MEITETDCAEYFSIFQYMDREANLSANRASKQPVVWGSFGFRQIRVVFSVQDARTRVSIYTGTASACIFSQRY